MANARYCYLCRSRCVAEDYCEGCRKTICSQCDEMEPTGAHEPEAHKFKRGVREATSRSGEGQHET